MKRTASPALVAGSVLALLLLAANMAITVVSTQQLGHDAEHVRHSNDVLLALQGVLSLAQDAETGQRGYVITGEPAYLEPYRTALRSISAQVERLNAFVADRPEAAARMAELRQRVNAKLGELDLTIGIRERNGLAAAQEIIGHGRGKAEMDALRAVVATMAGDERRALDDGQRAAAASYRRALTAGVVSGAAGLIGVVAFVLLLRRHLVARDLAEAMLAAEAEKYRTTLLSIGDAVIATDVEGRVTSMNTVAESLTGWRDADARGQPLDRVFRIVNEATRAEVASPVTRALAEGVIVGLANHTVLIARTGEERPIDDSAAPIRGAEGATNGAVLVFRDISERKKTERALKEAEARLRRVVMEMAVPTMAFADDGDILFVNDAWTQATGYPRSDLPTLDAWTAKAYPERAGFMRQHIASLFTLTQRVDSGERRIATADGTSRVWHFYTAPIGRDATGRRLLVTNAIDVTALRQGEARPDGEGASRPLG